MLRLLLRFLVLSTAIAAAACGRQHDLGAGGSSSTSSDTGGASTATSSSSSSGAGGATSSSSSSGTGGVDAGPSGPTELTIVNGINDYPAIRLCFLPGDTPWPSATTGLAFADSKVVSPLATSIPTDGDVTPWVIAGDLAQTSGKTCTQILALAAGGDGGTPTLFAQPLAVIPKSVWASNKSLLMVPNGCLGGPGHDDPNAKSACGSSYTPSTPTAGVTLVAMSRIQDGGHVSLQVASASPALPEMDVRVLPNLMDAMPVPIVYALTQGGIGPTPPFAQLTDSGFGPLDGAQIQTFSQGNATATSSVPFADIFANGGVPQSAFVNGASLVLVAVGSAPSLPAGKFWRPLTYALIAADPG